MLESREMNKKLVGFVILFIFLVFTACSAQAGNQISTASIPTVTKKVVVPLQPTDCLSQPELLTNLEARLPYDQKVVLYQAFAGEQSLVIWFVEPELGIEYTAENEEKALLKAVEAAQIITQSLECDGVYDMLHISVVAVDYTLWFSGAIRPEDIPPLDSTGIGGIPEEERGAGVTLMTAEPPALPDADACDWRTASAALETDFSELGLDADFYFTRDANGNNVFAHWILMQENDPLESLPLLELAVEQIDCLYPEPTGISLTVAGEDGIVVLSGYLPKTQSGEQQKFNLADFSYQWIELPQ